MCESEGGHGWVRTEELFKASLKVLKEMYGLEKRKQSSVEIIFLPSIWTRNSFSGF